MNHTKAFTLMEAMVALIIGASALIWASQTQLGSVNRLFLRAGEFDRMFYIKQELYTFFMNPLPNDRKPVKKKYESPSLEITTGYEEISKKSSLYPWRERIRLVRSQGTWSTQSLVKHTYKTSLITLVPQPIPIPRESNI